LRDFVYTEEKISPQSKTKDTYLGDRQRYFAD